MSHTSDILWEAILLDYFPTSKAAIVDYGLDKENADQIYAAYQRAVKTEKVTLQQLRKAVGDGPALTKLIGTPVKTAWDNI